MTSAENPLPPAMSRRELRERERAALDATAGPVAPQVVMPQLVMPQASASTSAPQPAPPKRPGAVSTGQATLLVWAIGMQVCVIVGLVVIYVGNMEPTRPSYGYGSTEDSSAGLVIVVLSILLPIVIFMDVIGRRIYRRYSE